MVLESQGQCIAGFFLGSQDVGNLSWLSHDRFSIASIIVAIKLVHGCQFIIVKPQVASELESWTEQPLRFPLCAFKADGPPPVVKHLLGEPYPVAVAGHMGWCSPGNNGLILLGLAKFHERNVGSKVSILHGLNTETSFL